MVAGSRPAGPCLRGVTSRPAGDVTIAALRAASADVFAEPALAPARDLLLLEGIELSPDTTFDRVHELELQAELWRYPVLL